MEHGLEGDSHLNAFCDRLDEGIKLSGTETFHITYLNEVDSALVFLSTIDSRYINASLDFKRKNNHIQQITQELYIEF